VAAAVRNRCGETTVSRVSFETNVARFFLINAAPVVDEIHSTLASDPFEQSYMRSLFDYGYEKGHNGHAWQKGPPGCKQ
jgi:hypothetical protein